MDNRMRARVAGRASHGRKGEPAAEVVRVREAVEAAVKERGKVEAKLPKPTDVCPHGKEYRFCRMQTCRWAIGGASPSA
jgi:hypothetical protein